jgi:hypothetical protein
LCATNVDHPVRTAADHLHFYSFVDGNFFQHKLGSRNLDKARQGVELGAVSLPHEDNGDESLQVVNQLRDQLDAVKTTVSPSRKELLKVEDKDFINFQSDFLSRYNAGIR